MEEGVAPTESLPLKSYRHIHAKRVSVGYARRTPKELRPSSQEEFQSPIPILNPQSSILKMDDLTQRIERAVAQFFPSATLLRTWPLTGGISASMTAFEIAQPTGETKKLIARQPGEYRFKHNPKAADHEFQVHRELSHTGLKVQTAHHIEDHPDRPFFILDYVEGKPEVHPANPQDFVTKFANQLTQIHQTNKTKLTSFPKQGPDPNPQRETLNETLREAEIRAALAKLGEPQNEQTLCHGDLWPGNVIWQNQEIAAVIDWEESTIGDPLSDLAISRLDIWWILGQAAADELTTCYEAETNQDLATLPYWDLCAALRPIHNIEEWSPSFPPLGRPDITTETMIRDHQAFVEQALVASASRR